MKFFYSPYTLESNHSLNALSSNLERKGALLKISFDAEKVGYADCHPWPELDDFPLEQQLQKLREGELTPLIDSAVASAWIDAQGRHQGKNLLIDKPRPKSHFLIHQLAHWTPEKLNQIQNRGFTHVKIKLGRNLDDEIKRLYSLFLNSTLKIRFDFNETLNFGALDPFLKSIERLKQSVDFIEDPIPFNIENWKKIQKKGWRLACDRQVSHAIGFIESAQFLVVKPAIYSLEEIVKWKKKGMNQTWIVTSYLGHPLEQVSAAYAATQIDPACSSIHGLMTHVSYKPTSWSRQLNWNSSEFIPPKGLGFGFDDDLKQLAWTGI